MSGTSGVGYTAFRAGFEISPIILTNGIASYVPGGMLPIVSITEPTNSIALLASGADPTNLANFFAHFEPLPGSDIENIQVGTYPFANQAVAANAIINQPLTISMLMKCPVKSEGGYVSKMITFLALKKILDKHLASGGTFTVITPTAFYENCLLLRLSDVSTGQSLQRQTEWQFDFLQPLLTLGSAQQILNTLMGKIDNGTSFTGTPSWTAPSSSTITVP